MQRHSRYLALLITKLAKRTDIYSDSGVEGLLSLVLLISLMCLLGRSCLCAAVAALQVRMHDVNSLIGKSCPKQEILSFSPSNP